MKNKVRIEELFGQKYSEQTNRVLCSFIHRVKEIGKPNRMEVSDNSFELEIYSKNPEEAKEEVKEIVDNLKIRERIDELDVFQLQFFEFEGVENG